MGSVLCFWYLTEGLQNTWDTFSLNKCYKFIKYVYYINSWIFYVFTKWIWPYPGCGPPSPDTPGRECYVVGVLDSEAQVGASFL